MVQLPVCGGHTGGKLVVRHRGSEIAFDFAKGAEDCFRWAAFFADCEHELQPVTSGARVVLIYRLVATAGAAAPRPVDNSHATETLLNAAKAWGADPRDKGLQLAIALDHKYSIANLAFNKLKARAHHHRR